MPLPKLPANHTARLFIEYTSAGQEHTMIVRLAAGATASFAADQYNTIRPLLAAFLPSGDAVRGARYSAMGSNVSFPIDVAPVAGSLGSGFDVANKPNFVSFTGRSQDGYRTKITIFSCAVVETERYRQTAPGSGPGAAFLNYLRNVSTNICTISGYKPVWNNYMNEGVNAYYQRKQRRTG